MVVQRIEVSSLEAVMQREGLPFYASGEVVRGFGRGSKQLGIPTANFPDVVISRLPKCVDTGVYYGFACVDDGPVHDMVMSIGWNPFFKNKQKSMETHILHQFAEDFYGSTLRVCIVGFIRGMTDFSSLDELITAINDDITVAREKCACAENQAIRQDSFFKSPLSAQIEQ